MVTNKKDTYKKYKLLRAKQLYGEKNLQDFRNQFIVWNKYYGSFLPENKDISILDVGCENGGIIYWLTQKGYKNSFGIDPDEDLINSAKSLGINNVSASDPLTYLGNSYGKYGVIFLLDFIEHIPKAGIIEMLGKVHDALSPSGVVIIKTSNAEGFFSNRIQSADLTHETSFTEASLKAALSTVGFSGFKCKEAGPVIHGIRSFVRFVLWKIIRKIEQSFLLVETGSSSRILTQNIIATARNAESEMD